MSAGSLIFAGNIEHNLGLLDTKLYVHCEKNDVIGTLEFPLPDEMHLSNTAGIMIRDIPNDCEVIDNG